MKKQLKVIIPAAGLVLLLAAAFFAHQQLSGRVDVLTAPTIQDEQRQRAPDFSMVDSGGNTVRLSELTGKPVVLNFWATWCPSCRVQMPDFDRVWNDFGGEVHFVMLNLTDGVRETMETANRYIETNGYSFPVYFDLNNEGVRAYGIRSIPTTVFISSDGYVMQTRIGAIGEDALRGLIELIH